jgi:hypothetical protein
VGYGDWSSTDLGFFGGSLRILNLDGGGRPSLAPRRWGEVGGGILNRISVDDAPFSLLHPVLEGSIEVAPVGGTESTAADPGRVSSLLVKRDWFAW